MERIDRLAFLALFTLLILGGIVPFPGVAAADPSNSVMGIVRSVDGTVVAVAGKTFDLKGAPILDARALTRVELSALRGRTVGILIKNRKIESVMVYPTLPQ